MKVLKGLVSFHFSIPYIFSEFVILKRWAYKGLFVFLLFVFFKKNNSDKSRFNCIVLLLKGEVLRFREQWSVSFVFRSVVRRYSRYSRPYTILCSLCNCSMQYSVYYEVDINAQRPICSNKKTASDRGPGRFEKIRFAA